MAFEDRKRSVQQEESRLIKYQHQHRGLNFLKLLLPPSADRKVNLVGLDNHIYRGSVPKVPEDQLPLEVDEKSIDEEALYKEIRDMNFPPVPEHEPLGPSRRIEGSYTLAKTLAFAPVQVEHKLEETMILGKDGGFYRGTKVCATTVELDKQLRGTKRAVTIMRQASSSQGFVEPTLVTLQIDSKFPSHDRHQKSIIKLPITDVRKITDLIKSEDAEKAVKMKESISEGKNEDIKDTAELNIKEDEEVDIKDAGESQEAEESITEDEEDIIKDVVKSQPDAEVEEPIKEDQTESSMDSEETEHSEESAEETDKEPDE